MEEALRESEAFTRAILSSLTAHITVLDSDGNIIAVNSAWERFARENGGSTLIRTGVGMNYLEVCQNASGESAEEAHRAYVGIQSVLDGSLEEFILEYPCHSPTEKRWFLLYATPFYTKQGGAIISHINITSRIRAEKALREMYIKLEKSNEDMLTILDQLRLGIIIIDESNKVSFMSKRCQPFMERTTEETVGKYWDEVCPFHQDQRETLEKILKASQLDSPKMSVDHVTLEGKRYRLEIEVHEDPRNSRWKILFLYDLSEVHILRKKLEEKASLGDLIGKSHPMKLIFQQIQDLSKVDSTVLIEGDTGTGKELVARALHSLSNRKGGPFIAINCAGLSESLVASQLFGHKRGSFTGAISDQKGVFEAAQGGTLFLDEIGDLPLSIQTNLLRVLQEREITRIGETQPRKIDVRLIAATNRDLIKEVSEGKFRRDLLYRIRVARIHLPQLRERLEDIPLLVNHFLRLLSASTGKLVQDVDVDTMRILMNHEWPGNIRELRNVIESAVIKCKGKILHADTLPPELFISERQAPIPNEIILDKKSNLRRRIIDALNEAKGNKAVAARLLGVGRTTLYRHLKDLGLISFENKART
ncbi:MAG TPA: sigma 54-interacting transcriptional regulator [Thermodesulfobacteriota bacterium]|nr:sigma 54-interacting transcriptional regulator [Thermodesulfobacteriota bacterium]